MSDHSFLKIFSGHILFPLSLLFPCLAYWPLSRSLASWLPPSIHPRSVHSRPPFSISSWAFCMLWPTCTWLVCSDPHSGIWQSLPFFQTPLPTEGLASCFTEDAEVLWHEAPSPPRYYALPLLLIPFLVSESLILSPPVLSIHL